MAINIPQTAILQIDETEGLNEAGAIIRSQSWKDDYGRLKNFAYTLKIGAKVDDDGSILRSWNLRRAPGNIGILALTISYTEDSEDPERDKAKKETWSLKSCRNDVSILSYCGESEGSSPNRYQIEMWQKETRTDAANHFRFYDENGEHELSAPSVELAKKVAKGVESVMRFYPQLTRRRLYSVPPRDVMKNLGFIDTPGTPGANAMAPGNLQTIVSAHEWVKIQDDCDEMQDGSWMRAESWIGILKSDDPNNHPWDPDLYGENRWSMPYNNQV